MANISTQNLQAVTADVIVQTLHDLTLTAAVDLHTFAAQIVADVTAAVQANDQDTLNQLLDQAKVVAEIDRVRVVQGQEQTFGIVLNALLQLLIAALLKAI